MRLSLKFTLSFLAGMGLVLAWFSYLRVQRELALFDRDFRADHEAMGSDLAAAVARIWDVGGEAAALAFVEEANASKSEVLIRWIARSEAASGEGPERVPAEQLERLAQDKLIHSQRVTLPDGPFLRTHVPVSNRGQWLGTLELAESWQKADRYVQDSVIRTLITTGVIIAITGVVAMLLGIWLVGQPVKMLVARARQVAAGDLSSRLHLNQSDELGVLAGEINGMCGRLAEANERVAAETSARIQALEQLRHADRLRTVGQLTSGIAHELGTPLNVVWERAKMIARSPDAPPAAVSCAEIIVTQSARMTRSIRQILDYSRPREPRKARIDLRQVLRQTISLLQTKFDSHSVSATIADPRHAIVVAVDVDQMQQVASNLLLNAVQAMPHGGAVHIELGTRRRHPPERPDLGEWAFFSVSDQGLGMAAEDLPRIFEPFFTTKEATEGTGLGLPISLGIVQEHGGWIDVRTAPGQGSCFTVYLPQESDAEGSNSHRG
jgi:signal transduction histidine kinase